MTRNFGRFHAPDARDRRFAIRVRATRGKKVWREGRRLDQGETPTCVGHGWAHWLLGYPDPQFLDPLGIYALAQQLDEWEGTDYDGTSVRAGAKVLSLLGFIERYEWATNVDAIVSAVLNDGPVVMGTNWYAAMDEADAKGVIRLGGENLGGHCYELTGVDTHKGLFRINNSWPQWALGGRAYIAIDDVAKLLAEEGEGCLAIERKAAPR